MILSVLSRGSFHGYAIARQIELQSEDTLKLREGTLYPALRSLELDGLILGTWQIQKSGPAKKVYALTENGQKELSQRAAEWRQYARIVGAIIGVNGGKTDEPAV